MEFHWLNGLGREFVGGQKFLANFLAKPSGFLMTKCQNKPLKNAAVSGGPKNSTRQISTNHPEERAPSRILLFGPAPCPQFESCFRWKLVLIESFCQDSNSGGGGGGGPEGLPDFLRPPGTAAFSGGLFWYLVIKNPDGLARKSWGHLFCFPIELP